MRRRTVRMLLVEFEPLDKGELRPVHPRTSRANVIEVSPFLECLWEGITITQQLLGYRSAGRWTVVEDCNLKIGTHGAQAARHRQRGMHRVIRLTGKANNEVKNCTDLVPHTLFRALKDLLDLG